MKAELEEHKPVVGDLDEEGQLEKICTVCFNKEADAIVMPCGHGGICSDCGTDVLMKAGTCCFCRKVCEVDTAHRAVAKGEFDREENEESLNGLVPRG